MKRWSNRARGEVDRPDVDEFLGAIEAVCRRYGMVISHEDGHGAFVIERFDRGIMRWLLDAQIGESLNRRED